MTSRIADEGLWRVAQRLATTPELLRAAMRGARRLSRVQVLALRDGLDLAPSIEAWFDRRTQEVIHV